MGTKICVFLLIGSIFGVTALFLHRIYRSITEESSSVPICQRSVAVNMLAAIIAVVALICAKSFIVRGFYDSRTMMLMIEGIVIMTSFLTARFFLLLGRQYKDDLVRYELHKLYVLSVSAMKLSLACLFLGLAMYIASYVAFYALIAYASGVLLILFLCAVIF